MDDYIVTRNPIDGCGYPVLVSSLQGVEDAQYLGGVAASGGRVGKDETDGLLGVDDKDTADREGDALGVDIGLILVVDHVVQVGDFAALVANDGKLEVAPRDLIDVLDPSSMALDGISGEANELCATLCELGLELCEGTKFSGADGSVVLWVREEDDPIVADELVEVNGALGSLGLEVGGNASQTERLGALFSHCGMMYLAR